MSNFTLSGNLKKEKNVGGNMMPSGPEGLSAYQIALKNGFAGSEEEWLRSLKGEPGDPGLPGDPGKPGYTPIRGVDYFTAEDVKKIVEECLETFPLASSGSIGLVSIPSITSGGYGLKATNQETVPGGILIQRASQDEIDKREQGFKPIVPKTLNYAVRSAITNNDLPMSGDMKRSACKYIGTLNIIENSDGSITVTLPSGKTKKIDLSKIEIFL